MPPARLVPLVCASLFSCTFLIGAFPPLLPELGRARGLSDAWLGTVAAAFGLARLVVDVPIGLWIRRDPRPAVLLGPVLLTAGLAAVAADGPLALLLAGRALMGVGHALGMLAGLTIILHHAPGGRVALALSAFELAAMLGMLGGAGVLGLMPPSLPWQHAYALASSPLLASAALAPLVVGALPRGGPGPGVSPGVPAADHGRQLGDLAGRQLGDLAGLPAGARTSVVLAFAAGTAAALAWSSVEQLVLPIRGTREFGLDRAGIARLLMLGQAADIVALVPVALLADRWRLDRVLGGILLLLGAGSALVALGPYPAAVAGAVLLGVGMGGWMLPLGLLRETTPPGALALRTALYRIGVDAGIFAGPLLAGLAGAWDVGLVPGIVSLALLGLGATLLVRRAPR